jgi:hypothetical protein
MAAKISSLRVASDRNKMNFRKTMDLAPDRRKGTALSPPSSPPPNDPRAADRQNRENDFFMTCPSDDHWIRQNPSPEGGARNNLGRHFNKKPGAKAGL